MVSGNDSGGAPGPLEVRQACKAGFEAIDTGGDPDTDFMRGFVEWMDRAGYVQARDIACSCADAGEHGHAVECRWSRLGATFTRAAG